LSRIKEEDEAFLEIAKSHNTSIEVLRAEIQKRVDEHYNVLSGLRALEKELGTGVVLTKEELTTAVVEQFVWQRNLKTEPQSDEKTVNMPTPQAEEDYPWPGRRSKDAFDNICTLIYRTRLHNEEQVAKTIEEKGF